MATLSPFLHQLQVGLFIMSGLLGLGAIYGLLTGADDVFQGLSPIATVSGKAVQQDQRLAARTQCDMLLELLDKAECKAGTGRLLNISATGACFVSSSILLKNEMITATLPTMRKGANKISGRVVWLRSRPGSTLYGIRLNAATPA